MPRAGAEAAREPSEDNVLSHLSLASGVSDAKAAPMSTKLAGADPTSDQILRA